MENSKNNKNRGQVMMIVVMVLSAVMVGSMAVSGLLTARQTRQSADAGSFAKAVYAADAGFEWRLFKFIKDQYHCKNCNDGEVCGDKPFEDSVLTTTCNQIQGSDEDYDYFRITSIAKYDKTSYTVEQEISVIK